MMTVRVNDLKQYAYCPRIVFYQYAMPVEKKPTRKMELGKREEERIDRLERRRKLREYRLDEGERRFHVSLNSARLGLSGKVDLVIDSPEGLFPVDFKLTTRGSYRNHILQLCGYSLLLEDCYGRPVDRGFIYLIPKQDAIVVKITPELKAEAMDVVERIRRMVAREEIPPPTPVRSRCVDCEFRNFCGDVF